MESGRRIDRRSFLKRGAAGAVAGLAALPLRSWAEAKPALSKPVLETALRESAYVYVSPLKSNGDESECHGEVWYAWLDGAVVVTVPTDRWKSRSIDRGLDRARIWVGDHGRWKGLTGRNEAFREAPFFDARAEKLWDEALLDRLLAEYDRKYPDSIGRWRDRMKSGNADRSRVLIRYEPIANGNSPG